MSRHSESTLATIKNAVDIVALVGEYLPVSRSGSKFKALCPFHDDHNPSLELNPDRQSYKCWSCGAGGDVFDFVMEYERVEFPEALRMLAERAGVALESPSADPSAPRGPSKSELFAVNAWAEGQFREALTRSEPGRAYLDGRGIGEASVRRFHLGYAPGERGWLVGRARREKIPLDLLERAGLAVRRPDDPDHLHQRFSGRVIFPIHDLRGRAIGFGGRVLPEVERFLASKGKNVAKYLNSPQTPVFEKRRVLYAWDLARSAARESGWVAVVEGYTDVIAAHQVGLCNVVGTLGTALGDDHVQALRRLADRVVLVFDGDDAGQNAADKALELFLGHEVDVRVLTLPENLDPCDFLLQEGADAFRSLVDEAVDPLKFALGRAETRFDLKSIEGSRLAAEWLLSVFASVPAAEGGAVSVKVDKAVDSLAQALGLTKNELNTRLRKIRRTAASKPALSRSPLGVYPAAGPATAAVGVRDASTAPASTALAASWRPTDLDATDRELVQTVLNNPEKVRDLSSRVTVDSLRDAPLRAILQACFDLNAEGVLPTFERVALRIDDPAVRALAAGLLLPIDSAPLPDDVRPAPWDDRLRQALVKLDERDRQRQLRELKGALDETNEADDPATYRALKIEYFRLSTQRPDTKNSTAS